MFLNKRMLPKIQIVLFAFFFIFNFVDRAISNVFLILTLISCLYDFSNLKSELIKNKNILIAVILFSTWIIIIGFYHNSPLSELDNYFRFLLLLPLFVLKIEYRVWKTIIVFSGIAVVINLIFDYSDYDVVRFKGTSSHPITYANMITTLLLLLALTLRDYTSKKITFILLLCLISILFFAWITTATRGPIIGLVLAIIIIIFWYRSKLTLFLTLLPFFVLFSLPNHLNDRLSSLIYNDINFDNTSSITQFLKSDTIVDGVNTTKNHSLKERISYLVYGSSIINRYPIVGIGPHNIERSMKSYLNKKGYSAESRDHLHNEYIDISAKFGLPSLFLLLLIYFNFINKSYLNLNKSELIIVMIMLVSSQLTQSHFAHHQAITFFISAMIIAYNLKKT